ncbi:MHYT domain-containing protein [Streptomyces sp. NPDC018693]|uniref:MHYT domain-containing protein n=1 Tax=unclassified Streptomyces TaxID=2593676 RepID=UPI0037A64451
MLSLAVAVVVVGVGVFVVGHRGATPRTAVCAGAVTGLGVAAMHLGMAAVQSNGSVECGPLTVALSVAIAVGAATAALWAAVTVRGFMAGLGASLVMFDPLLVLGDGEWNRQTPPADGRDTPDGSRTTVRARSR